VSIKKLPDGRYEWRHRVGGKHLKKVFDRRSDAVAHDSRIRADQARGIHVDLTSRTTVAERFRAWSDARVIRPGTRKNHEKLLRIHIEGTPLGARPLVRVRPSEVQAWVRSRTEVLAPETVRNHAIMLHAVFADAVMDGLIAVNPVHLKRLSLPKEDKPKFVPLTIGQVQAWAEAAPPHVQAMVLTQAGLGLRISELLSLRVADIDFLRREVSIHQQLDRLAPIASAARAPLKTAGSRRKVPLPSVTAEVLAEHIRRFPPGPDGSIFMCPWGRGSARRGLWNPTAQSRAYRAAAAAAGLPSGTTSHDLRHHYASVLLAAGESLHTVAERVGDTPQMVLTTYGHVMPDQEDRTRRVIDAAWKDAGREAGAGNG
jgi:integrase